MNQNKLDLIQEAIERFNNLGVNYSCFNNTTHFRVLTKDTVKPIEYDFYPTTGLWICNILNKKGKGIDSFIKEIGIDDGVIQFTTGINKYPHQWDILILGITDVARLKVPGGWLVSKVLGGITSDNIIFIKDQNHEWEIER